MVLIFKTFDNEILQAEIDTKLSKITYCIETEKERLEVSERMVKEMYKYFYDECINILKDEKYKPNRCFYVARVENFD